MAIHDENNLTCPECDKTFSRLASFKQHLTIHVREELFVCPECSDEFPSKVCRALLTKLIIEISFSNGNRGNY